jgi:hypothetical protein
MEGATGREKNDTVKRFLDEYTPPSPVPLTPYGDGNGDGDGDGDGESYHDSYHDSYHESSISPIPSVSKVSSVKYGTFKNIILSKVELEKLMRDYPDYIARIDRLSEYVASKGVKYKSHYATILSWARKDGDNGSKRYTQGNAGAGHGTGSSGSNPVGDGDDYSQLQVIRC